jgi:signal peptidase I
MINTDKTTKTVIIAALLTTSIAAALLIAPVFIVVGDSMEPTVQTPGIVYCTPVEDPAELDEGTIIAYQNGDKRVFHRISRNPGTLNNTVTISKDNPEYDMKHLVDYDDIICEVNRHTSLNPDAYL